jgi:hypothetical protein
MAFVQNPQDDEEEKAKQGQPQAIAGTDQLGVGSAGATGAGPTAGSFNSPQSSGLSGFTDVAAYLDANRDQAQDLAGKVAAKFGEQATQARSDIDSANQQFNQSIDQSTVNPNEDLVNRAASDPSGFVGNPDDLAQFMKMRDAQYGGPTQFEGSANYAKLQGEVQGALANKGNIDTEQGRQQLLYGLGTNPTAGQVTLDQLLLGADPNARATLANAAAPFAGLSDYLDNTSKAANAHAAQAKDSTGHAAQLVSDKFTNAQTGVIPQFQQGLQAHATDAEKQRELYNWQLNDVIGKLQSGQSLAPGEIEKLGLQPGQIESLYSINSTAKTYGQQAINPAEYLLAKNPVNTPATVQNTASDADYAKAAALQQLMGQSAGLGLDPAQRPPAMQVPDRLGGFDYQGAHQAAVGNLMNMDKAFIDAGPPTYPGADTSTWLIQAKQAQARLANPDLYNQPFEEFAPTQHNVSIGGGVIDPQTGQPIYNNPPPPAGGGGRAFR